MTERLTLPSVSRAMDGGLTAIADVASVLDEAGKLQNGRLIGGVTVVLHQLRLSIDLPLRSTADADFGVPPYLLREPGLVDAIEARGYRKVKGNRWERPIDETRTATVDLLVPTYRTRARNTVQIGDVVTTEVPGLAEALRRPGQTVRVDVIPDPLATIALKAWARTVRQEDRDAEDLWRCLEIAQAAGVTSEDIRDDPTLDEIVPILAREFAADGRSMAVITRDVNPDEAARRRTRVRALLAKLPVPPAPSNGLTHLGHIAAST